MLQDKIVAGKTPVGAAVQAKLQIATLVDGTVIPRNAVLSGEVVESSAMTSTTPSLLSIRIDSAHWKKGSAPLQAYLTSWYYPIASGSAPDLQSGPEQPANRTWNGMGQYPDPGSPAYRPFPGSSDTNKDAPFPDNPSTVISKRRVPMKDVESHTGSNGLITLSSARSNLKLDKLTTYVMATGTLLPPPAK